MASVYFNGYTGRTAIPGSILFVQYPTQPVAAYLQSGNVTSLGLPAIQALAGSLTVVVDGYTHTAGNLSLSGATSFSAAAALLQQGLDANEPVEASFTGSIAGNLLTVSAVASGTLSVGQTITAPSVAANTIVTALGTGSGLAGTYTVSGSQTVASEAMTAVATAPTVTFDSQSGAFFVTSGITGAPSTAAFATGPLAASLLMTQATGAILSQGEAFEDPATFMTGVANLTQDWATFTTDFDPDLGNGNAQKLAFAAWTNAQANRYLYVPWDHDVTPTETAQAAASLGALLASNNYSGTFPIYEPATPAGGSSLYHAAFVCGAIASIDFSATNGRITLAYRSQTGLVAGVSAFAVSTNLEANGYNYVGANATANERFVFLYPGTVSGPFQWADSYVNQIWLNNELQLALIELLTQVGSIPFNAAGYNLIEGACADPIQAALNFGAIRAGITLSDAQRVEINNVATGLDIATTLQAQGWYLLIQNPTAQVRATRKLPNVFLFYTDGESVQQITLTSTDVE